MMAILRRIVQPLKSRKVRVGLATVLAAYAAQYHIGLSPEILLTILSVGVALILGIAHEDNGEKRNPERPLRLWGRLPVEDKQQ